MADEGRNTILRYSNSIVLRCQLNKIVSINTSFLRLVEYVCDLEIV
jgi:hypothetical protein